MANPTAKELTCGRLLARNAAWNFISQCVPMATAIVTMPVLIRGLGTDRFGLLTLAWMLLGYFSLFDLGLGRALTKLVAEKLGLGLRGDIPPLIWTAIGLMMLLGAAGSVVVGAISPWLVRAALKVPEALQGEALGAFLLMAVALPFLISTAGLRGVMEAHQQFGAINLVRTAIGMFCLLGPLLVLPFSTSLVPVVGVIFAGRLISWGIHTWLCFRTVPELRQSFRLRPDLIGPLLRYGGWMTVANVVNPLMVQMDRFLVGAFISTAAVAYYTTPYELVTKYWFLSNAVLGVVFPAFATSFAGDRTRTAFLFGRCVKHVYLLLFPAVAVTVAMAPEILGMWLGADFALQSTPVMRWLALGVLLCGLAQVPSALLQGIGRPDLTAKLHVIELPLYLPTAWYLIHSRGIEGAAIAWSARTAIDFVLFFGTARMVLPEATEPIRRTFRILGPSLAALALCALPFGFASRALILSIIALTTVALTWRYGLSSEEKSVVLERLPIRRSPGPVALPAADASPSLG